MSGEEIPLEKNDADTVVVTYTLCTIPDVLKALIEKSGFKIKHLETGYMGSSKLAIFNYLGTAVSR
ncbi:MAG: hypothetical protein KKD21_00410 [Proteobacteria bacterium]|nr:hypothetical protein [Pseudomonadota bacterium]MBU1695492.1 hypothetical protein [Pseudomonadota bacterium]